MSALDALRATALQIRSTGDRRAQLDAWARWLGGPGWSQLAEEVWADPGSAEAALAELAAVDGWSGRARDATASLRRAVRDARRDHQRLEALRHASRRVADVTPLERGDEYEVACLSIVEQLHPRGAPVGETLAVYDRGAVHEYDPESGAWVPHGRAHYVRQVAEYAGYPVAQGTSPDGTPRPPRALSVSHSFATGAAALQEAILSAPGYFNARRRGCGFRNGFLDEHGTLHPHDPAYRTLPGDRLDIEYSPVSHESEIVDRCPAWLDYLDSLWLDDEDRTEKARLLMQFLGCAVLGTSTDHSRALILYGPTASNGKSTLLGIISEMFPDGSSCSIPPQNLGTKHENVRISSARVNLVTDMPESQLADSGLFKSIVSGEQIQLNPKNGQPYEVTPRAAHIYAANATISVRDRSQGFYRRIILLTFNRVFDPSDPNLDRSLIDQVRTEIPGIVAASVWHALQMRGSYDIPESSRVQVLEWQRIADNVASFLDEFTPSLDAVRTKDVYSAYRLHCGDTGTNPVKRNKFLELLETRGFRRDRKRCQILIESATPEGADLLVRAAQGGDGGGGRWKPPPMGEL